MQLHNKVAIITGSASGIGREAARLFAAEGAKVVVSDLNEQVGAQTVQAITSDGGEAVFCRCDVTELSDLENLVETAKERFGGVDVYWHNAGTIGNAPTSDKPGYHPDLSEADWDEQMNVHLKAGFFGARLAVANMIERGGGSILFTSSAAALKPPVGAAPPYPLAKHGLILLTKMMATSLAPQGIRVNAVCPASIKTPMIEELMQSEATRGIVDALVEQMPMGRVLEMSEVAQAALFLASDQASAITGTILAVDGGRTSM